MRRLKHSKYSITKPVPERGGYLYEVIDPAGGVCECWSDRPLDEVEKKIERSLKRLNFDLKNSETYFTFSPKSASRRAEFLDKESK